MKTKIETAAELALRRYENMVFWRTSQSVDRWFEACERLMEMSEKAQ